MGFFNAFWVAGVMLQAAVGTEELWFAQQCEKSFISMHCLLMYEHE